MHILVSSCLLGEPCRYDGTGKLIAQLKQLERAGHTLVSICPEGLGGLPTPRSPAELQQDGSVRNREGEDVTCAYELGARLAVELANEYGCSFAVLKAKSPSCGNAKIYDGSFTGTLIAGQGLAAMALERAGVTVFNETQLQALLSAMGER